MQRLENRIPPPIIAASVALAMWAVATATPSLNLEIPARTIVASICAVLGIAIMGSGVLSFIKARTTVDPLNLTKVSVFVQFGVFRATRNPMYLGMAAMLLAWAIFLGNPLTLVGVAVFIAFITRFQIIPEERVLAARFGHDYEAYRRCVRRWM